MSGVQANRCGSPAPDVENTGNRFGASRRDASENRTSTRGSSPWQPSLCRSATSGRWTRTAILKGTPSGFAEPARAQAGSWLHTSSPGGLPGSSRAAREQVASWPQAGFLDEDLSGCRPAPNANGVADRSPGLVRGDADQPRAGVRNPGWVHTSSPGRLPCSSRVSRFVLPGALDGAALPEELEHVALVRLVPGDPWWTPGRCSGGRSPEGLELRDELRGPW
jgi:hypothetical protein